MIGVPPMKKTRTEENWMDPVGDLETLEFFSDYIFLGGQKNQCVWMGPLCVICVCVCVYVCFNVATHTQTDTQSHTYALHIQRGGV